MSPRQPSAGLAALGAGFLMALSMPPWGWWPLGIIAITVLDRLVDGRSRRSAAARGFLFAVVWFAMGMGWMWFLTAPGYVVAATLYAGFVAASMALGGVGRARRWTLPAAFVVQEWIRFRFPFGGVPLASVAIGQATGPLAPLARIGGTGLIAAATVVAGQTVRALVPWITGCWRQTWRPVTTGTAAIIALLSLAVVAPHGHDAGAITLSLVQGGGPQGTHAVEGGRAEERRVFDRHLTASATVGPTTDVVIWPENTVNVTGTFAASPERLALIDLARRLDRSVTVGIVEDAPAKPTDEIERFYNAQIVITGQEPTVATPPEPGQRYDKVHRVPFGEYMPLRSLLEALGAPVDLVPKNSIAGTGPAVIDVPSPVGTVRFGVVISWEVFFGDRARDAIGNGGAVLLNPTNGSSYTGTVLQSQQIASSRLRAIETGRWVAQVAPTGFSAFISPDGAVHQRTGISEQRVITRTIERRTGRTWYVRFGDHPFGLAALVVMVVGLLAARRGSTPEEGPDAILGATDNGPFTEDDDGTLHQLRMSDEDLDDLSG